MVRIKGPRGRKSGRTVPDSHQLQHAGEQALQTARAAQQSHPVSIGVGEPALRS